MTIRKRLYLAYGVALAVTIVSGAVSMFTFNTIGAKLQRIAGMEMKKMHLGGELNSVTSDMVAEERGILLRAIAKDADGVDKLDQQFAVSTERFKKALDDLTFLVETPEARKKFEGIKAGFERITPIHTQVVLFASIGDMEKAEALQRDQLLPLIQELKGGAEDFVDGQKKRLGKVSDDATSTLKSSSWFTVGAIAISIIVAVFIVLSIKRISDDLQGIVFELGNGSDQVASAASQVSSSSQSLAQGASELASSLQETAASTEEVKSMASNNAEGAAQAADLIHGTTKKIDTGNKKLSEMVASMQEISDSSQKISKIIKTIDEIAFQTNILALNAAVEAARAGEAGMGFAVVADEVRNLAQRCAQAANDTSTLIEDSITKSQNGSRKLDEVASAIAEITADAASVKKISEASSVSSGEQKKALNNISEAVTGMESVTQRTAASAEEGAAAGEELSAQSQSLHEIVARLSAMVGAPSNQTAMASVVTDEGEPESHDTAWNISFKKVQPSSTPQHHDVSSFPLEDDFKEM